MPQLCIYSSCSILSSCVSGQRHFNHELFLLNGMTHEAFLCSRKKHATRNYPNIACA
uniref:Uncharacterized protein n=1 Tax=Arundo donax TaxID=35708 RepID=A0A0A8YR42_ARUDO